MDIVKISESDFKAFVDKKIAEKSSHIISVVRKGTRFAFDELDTASRMCLDYDVTILPPKKYFQPPEETLLRFVPKKADSYEAVNDYEPLTLIGVHYYDLAAIYLMDRAFSEGEKDANYLTKRQNTLLVGLYPTRSFKHRFSNSVVKGEVPYKVADLMLINMNDGNYAIEIVSEKGRAFLESAGCEKSDYSLQAIEDAKKRIKDDEKLPIPAETTPDYLKKNYSHPVWEVFGEKCYSCGSCVLVCPTCYCFDMKEEVDVTLESGERKRVWDGCMIEHFATCAGGHNFRQKRSDRFRHRIFRKGVILPSKYHYWGCVGCGRCADACTSSIAGPVKVFNYIEEKK
jgi:sulfhydrogenase subunit beta (sulfur reductase)